MMNPVERDKFVRGFDISDEEELLQTVGAASESEKDPEKLDILLAVVSTEMVSALYNNPSSFAAWSMFADAIRRLYLQGED